MNKKDALKYQCGNAEHGKVLWAFRVMASPLGVLEDVFLVRINKEHKLQETFIKYFIVGKEGHRGESKSPMVDVWHFEKLMNIDGEPGGNDNFVAKLLEKVFSLGFYVGVNNQRKVDKEPLNEFVRTLSRVAEAHKLNVGPTQQVVRNVYRWAVLLGKNW